MIVGTCLMSERKELQKMENLLYNTYALLALVITIVGGIDCLINLVLKKKKKAKELFQHLSFTDQDIDKKRINI